MRLSIVLSLFIALCPYALAQCRTTCRFSMCMQTQDNPLLPRTGLRQFLRPNRQPMGGVFCMAVPGGAMLLTSVALKEAVVRPSSMQGAPFVPISSYSPAGLTDPYDNKFFKRTKGPRIGQAITRKASLGNQLELANDLCVVLPLQKWKVTNPTTGVSGSFVRGTDDMVDCVSIRPISTSAFIEIDFNSLGDYGLMITEPDGTVISPMSPTSPSGGELQNPTPVLPPCWIAPAFVGYTPMRRESVTYPLSSTIPSGDYKVKIVRRSNCDSGTINLRMLVVVNGAIFRKQRRTFTATGVGSTVAMFKFTIP